MQIYLIIKCNGDKLLLIYFQSITSDLIILYIPHNLFARLTALGCQKLITCYECLTP